MTQWEKYKLDLKLPLTNYTVTKQEMIKPMNLKVKIRDKEPLSYFKG